MSLSLDVFHDVCCYLPNRDLLPIMLSCKNLAMIGSKFLHPTQEHFNNAILNNDPIAVRSLLKYPQIDPIQGPITQICRKGHVQILKILLQHPRFDPTASEYSIICSACSYGQTEIVRLLLEDGRCHPSVADNYPILVASCGGYVDVVRLLLQDPRVDPSAKDNVIVKVARNFEETEVVELLLQDPRVQATYHP